MKSLTKLTLHILTGITLNFGLWTFNSFAQNIDSIRGSSTVCQGQKGVVYMLNSVTNTTNYTWNYTGNGFSIVSGAGTNGIIANFSESATSGTLTILANNACGSGITSPAFSITVNPLPAAPVAYLATSIAGRFFTANWKAVAGDSTYYLDVDDTSDFSSPIAGYNNKNVGNVLTSIVTGLTCGGTNYYYRLRAGNACGIGANSNTITVTTDTCPASGSQTFTSASAQTFIVPVGVVQITIKIWGGGGAGGTNTDGLAAGAGGGGGYAEAQITVTPGEVLDVYVGGGGTSANPGIGGFNGGGNGGPLCVGGGGGGASDVRRAGTKLIIASGGGGGGGKDQGTKTGGAGGAGGGSNGLDGDYATRGGKGGTQSSGGAAGGGGATAGTLGQGGVGGIRSVNQGSGGGGGGGYYGGGGGSQTGTSQEGNGGGGGSSYIPTGGTTMAGSGSIPGNSGDSLRGTAGNGGAPRTNGQPGKVIIFW